MNGSSKIAIFAAGLVATATYANAADVIPVMSRPAPVVEAVPEVKTAYGSGWYLRGDIGWAKVSTHEVTYYMTTPTLLGRFEKYDISDGWMIGGGIGYQATDYFRVDLTGHHYLGMELDGSTARNVPCESVTPSGADSCSYSETGDLSVTTVLANAYLDLGKFSGFSPYVGAGIGGAKVQWGDITNKEYDDNNASNSVSSVHGGNSEWRFAWALHGGMSYDLSENLKLDAGYTFTHIEGGHMFNFEAGNIDGNYGQQGFDGVMKIHAVRAGLRWMLD